MSFKDEEGRVINQWGFWCENEGLYWCDGYIQHESYPKCGETKCEWHPVTYFARPHEKCNKSQCRAVSEAIVSIKCRCFPPTLEHSPLDTADLLPLVEDAMKMYKFMPTMLLQYSRGVY